MRVVISTSGRYHLFPLAKELESAGVLTRIYSGFTWSALKREGVSRSLVRTFPVVRPALMALRFLPFAVPGSVRAIMTEASLVLQDHFVAHDMPDCDVFVGHEGVGLVSGLRAQKRGAKYVCDRGCSHVGWQENLLAEEYDRLGIKRENEKPRTFDREIEEYNSADLIVVPSKFAAKTFHENGYSDKKVAVDPYGVNTSNFSKVANPNNDIFDIIFVGNSSVRKGIPYLLDGFSRIPIKNKRLTLVGGIDSDIKQAYSSQLSADNIRVLGHVPHLKLKDLMSRSHVLILPSIEDGMGMVVSEALACGCPAIVTENAGASEFFEDGREGFIIPIRDPDAIADKCTFLASNPEIREKMSSAAIERIQSIGGWDQYGKNMIDIYANLIK